MTVASPRTLRFGVRAVSGHCAATWKVWSEDQHDVYLTCRALGGYIKASMHASGRWHVAFTPAAYSRFSRASTNRLPSRFADKWPQPTENAPGLTLCYQIVVPWSAATSRPTVTAEEIVWVPPAAEGFAVEFAVLFTKRPAAPGQWPGQRAMNSRLIGFYKLDRGPYVWVVWTTQPFSRLPDVQGIPAYLVANRNRLFPPSDMRSVLFAHTPAGARAIYDVPFRPFVDRK